MESLYFPDITSCATFWYYFADFLCPRFRLIQLSAVFSASDSIMCSNNNGADKTDLVTCILLAEDLYEVLGIPQADANDKSAVRKAYLTRSVQVHPDKNSHPQATQAFQRVAEAWQTLSDDQMRAKYNAELRQPQGARACSSHQTSSNTQYAGDFERSRMPSMQEAMFLFATVTSMFAAATSGGSAAAGSTASRASAAGDFMETLLFAQKLAEQYQGQSNKNGNRDGDSQDRSNNDNNTDGSADPLESGMMLGSGLRAIAGAQRMLGFHKSAAAMEKAATGVQVAAVGAKIVQDNPAVQRTLERGSTAVQNNPNLKRSLGATFKLVGSVLLAVHQVAQEEQQVNGGGDSSSRR